MCLYMCICECVCVSVCNGVNGVKLFRKHTLSPGSLSCSGCKCLQWFPSVRTGISAADKTASLYQSWGKDNAAGCCGLLNKSSEIKDVKKLLEAMLKWFQRAAGGGEEGGGLLGCLQHSGSSSSSRSYRWGGSMSVTLFSFFTASFSLSAHIQVSSFSWPDFPALAPPNCVKVVSPLHRRPCCGYAKCIFFMM